MVPIDRNVLRKLLSLKQQVIRAVRFFIFPEEPIRFIYTPDAMYGIEKNLPVAITAGICESNMMQAFLKTHKDIRKVL